MRTVSTLRPSLFLTLCAALLAACSEPADGEPVGAQPTGVSDGPTTTTSATGTPTPTATATATPSATVEPMPTATMTATVKPMPTATMTATVKPMPTATMAATESAGGAGGGAGAMPTGGSAGMGGGGETGAAGAGEALEAMTFEEVTTFLDTSIAGQSTCFDCHKQEGDLPYVFKKDDTLYDTLTTSVIEKCGNRVLVVPGQPEDSALYLVLQGMCDDLGRMPNNCVQDEFFNGCAEPSDIGRIRLWIEDGAPQ